MASQSPPKRPRLSLQIKALSTGPSIRTSRTLAAVVNPRSPTSFNTLSNVYSTAIDRSTATPVPATAEPLTAIKMTPKRLPELPRLQMPDQPALERRTQTPYVATQFPETPLTAMPMSPAVAMEIQFPSTMTATPPLSAGPIDPGTAQNRVFCFSPDDVQKNNPLCGTGDLNIIIASDKAESIEPAEIPNTQNYREGSVASSVCSDVDTPFPSDLQSSPPQAPPTATRRRITAPAVMLPGKPAPYVHPRSLHSILRNSPLPPRTARSPDTPRRQSQRLLEKASRHVMYNSPLTQTITTNTYTKSHIDLLCEEASPYASPSTNSPGNTMDAERALDLTLAYSGNETRDGGTTPGPFEEMRRRMAGLGTNSAASSPISPGSGLGSISSGGIRKRKQPRREKKRRWVWTLGQDDEEEESLSGAMAALKAAQKAEEEAAAAAAARAAAEKAEADLKTPLATQSPNKLIPPTVEAAALPDASQDIEMQDSTLVESVETQPEDARKRKSTPIPSLDGESDAGSNFGGDDDGDVDMQTPTAVLGQHLQGAWMQAVTALTVPGAQPDAEAASTKL